MTRGPASLGVLLLLGVLLVACATEVAPAPPPEPERTPDRGWRATSDSGRLVGWIHPEADELVAIGQFQTWVLELRDASGAGVSGAAVAITGGMPAHGHGLPTQPRVSEELGGGRYRIEGVKLNMVGAWVIEVFVQTSALRDRLRFDLTIDY
jgi:hypothetical protein